MGGGWKMNMEHWWKCNGRGEVKHHEKHCPPRISRELTSFTTHVYNIERYLYILTLHDVLRAGSTNNWLFCYTACVEINKNVQHQMWNASMLQILSFYDDHYTVWPVVITFKAFQVRSRSLALILFYFLLVQKWWKLKKKRLWWLNNLVMMQDEPTNDSGR